MKRLLTVFIASAFMAMTVSAQTKISQADYLSRYDHLVSAVGSDGVGVETLIEKWENDYPEDCEMLLAKFTYYLSKSRTVSIEPKEQAKYLGAKPVLSLKDSLGRNVNYFQVPVYDDELFSKSSQAIDKAISIAPDRLDFRLFKISALFNYEGESPDMALAELNSLIDYNGKENPAWVYPGVEVDNETFPALVQEYCYAFFKLGTPTGFEAFKDLSDKMLSYYPDQYLYLTNIGSYYFVYKHDDKTALKYYNKVLKKHPDDYPTIRNCVLLARNEKNVKLEKKYLPMLINTTQDEGEKASSLARLKAL